MITTRCYNLLANYVMIHLELCQLIVATRPKLYIKNRFRIGHLLLLGFLGSKDPSLMVVTRTFAAAGTRAREAFGNGLANLFANIQVKLVEVLDGIDKTIWQPKLNNQKSHWAYILDLYLPIDNQSNNWNVICLN